MKIGTASGNKRNAWANIRVRRRQESKWKKAACLPAKRGGGGAWLHLWIAARIGICLLCISNYTGSSRGISSLLQERRRNSLLARWTMRSHRELQRQEDLLTRAELEYYWNIQILALLF